MNRRVLVAAFATLLVLPGAAQAQFVRMQDGPLWSGRARVTPFVGFVTSLVRAEEWTHSGSAPQYAQIDYELAGGGVAGLGLDIPLSQRVGISALAGYGSRGETVFTVLETEDVFRVDGSNFILGRLAVALHFSEPIAELVTRRIGASIWLGGVALHERPKNALGTGDFLEKETHYGVNFGFSGELPFADNRVAFLIGAEDNVIWWSKSTTLAYEYFGRPGEPELTFVSRDMSHMWLFRVGLGIRL